MILRNSLTTGLRAVCIIALMVLFSCTKVSYVQQNSLGYNEYKQVNNSSIKDLTKRQKGQSKTPSWSKYNSKNKYKRYH